MFPRLVSAKARGEVFPVYAMEAYRGSRGVAALILNFGACTGFMMKTKSRCRNLLDLLLLSPQNCYSV
jgi:hypothetical protein